MKHKAIGRREFMGGLAVGAAAMLVVAALIEGFWSPAAIPNAVKYVVGTLLWVLVAVYLATAGLWERKP